MRIVTLLLALCLAAPMLFAQDPAKVDPKHYKVEFENAEVRVLHIHYGAHEKSIMHVHPDAVVVSLTGGTSKMTMADGKTNEMTMKPGQAMFTPAGAHLPENVGDKPFDLVLVELKGPAKGAAKAAATK